MVKTSKPGKQTWVSGVKGKHPMLRANGVNPIDGNCNISHTVHLESIQKPWLFPHSFFLLQPYSKMDLKKINTCPSSIYTQYPHHDKEKTVFQKMLQKNIQNYTYLHKYSDPLIWDSKLSSGTSCFHWPSLRCFYNLSGVRLWYIQLIGHLFY